MGLIQEFRSQITFTLPVAESVDFEGETKVYEQGSSPHQVSQLRFILDITPGWSRYVGMSLPPLPRCLPGFHFQGNASDAIDSRRWSSLLYRSRGEQIETSL